MKTIKVGENQRVVKKKITFYGIAADDSKMVKIWLDGGGMINTIYPDSETAKKEFDELDKIMEED